MLVLDEMKTINPLICKELDLNLTKYGTNVNSINMLNTKFMAQ